MDSEIITMLSSVPSLRKVVDADPDPSIEVVDTPLGPVPLWSDGTRRLYIHSRYDPVKEAQRFVAECAAVETDIIIVLGFGFGYHVESLLALAERTSPVLVIEKSPSLLKMALECRDLRHLLADPSIVFLVDPSEGEVADALKSFSTKTSRLILHRGSHQIYPSYYDNMREIARSALASKDVNIATMVKFERTWSANIARNIARFVEAPGANIFYGHFTGIPAIVVSAGPSLQRSIDFIRDNIERAVIVAVDTSYRILESHGIEPHFCLTVDPQLLNARYFEGTAPTGTVLVADPTVHPSAVKLFRGPVVFTGIFFEFFKWIEELAGPRGEIAHGGSVSTNAYDFARRLGCSPVILTGQDLAFTRGLAHARGSYLDELVYHRNTRLFTPEMQNRRQLFALPAIRVKGIRGPAVHTNQKMMIFLSWFEKRRDRDLVNATPEGAFIPGVPHHAPGDIVIPIPDVLPRERVQELLPHETPRATVESRQKIASAAEVQREEIRSLVPLLEKALILTDELMVSFRSKIRNPSRVAPILRDLDDTDRRIEMKKSATDLVSLTIQRVIHTINEGYDIDNGNEETCPEEKIALRSRYLYSGLLEGCRYNLKILDTMTRLLMDE